MSLIEQVTQTITHALTIDLSEFIADHFGLDSNEVSNVVRDYLGHNSTPVSPVKKISKNSVHKPPTKAATSGVKTCSFKITRGSKEGQLCGTTIRGTGDFCSKHKNRKAAQPKTDTKKGSVGNNTNVTRDPKAKCWVISGTRYVVKSPQNKTVVGKIVGGKTISLTKADKLKIDALNIPISDQEDNE